MSLSKKEILEEIKRTAGISGRPPGAITFEKATGITTHAWHKYWARFSDALKDAGFAPNRLALTRLYSSDFLVEKVIEVMRELKKFPTTHELFLKKSNIPDFPYRAITKRFGSKLGLVEAVKAYGKSKPAYEDILKLLPDSISEKDDEMENLDRNSIQNIGEVYLFKSGKYYKIGKTNDTVRRGSELRIQLPENLNLVHSIKTDDPSGIETYWHRRFENKRMNGEWFDLNSADIKAFKHWRRIV